MFCYGPSKVDCDKIAVLGANVFAALESALGPLNDMPLLEKKFHIQNFLFWSIMGTILTWIGFIMVLYAEIKAILIVSAWHLSPCSHDFCPSDEFIVHLAKRPRAHRQRALADRRGLRTAARAGRARAAGGG
jgi:hypothetical protein